MGCGTTFVKYVLFFFNLLFALAGLSMIGVGVAVRLNWLVITKLLEQHRNFTVAPWLFIVVGAIIFVIAFFGCCGAIRESHCMVVTYAIFLLVLIIVQVILAVLLFVYMDSIDKGIQKVMGDFFNDSLNDSVSKQAFESMEIQFNCCGNTGPSNYMSGKLPDSCCSRGRGIVGNVLGTCTIADAGNKEGCGVVMGQVFRTYSKVIAGVAIGVACIEVVGALFALCLANSIRNMDRRYA